MIVFAWWWTTAYRCEKFVDEGLRRGIDGSCGSQPFFKAGLLIFPAMLLVFVFAGVKGSKWWYLALLPASVSLFIVLRSYGLIS